jgi:hypothetical protein
MVAIMAPWNSTLPLPEMMVIGEKRNQKIYSQTFKVMNRFIPEANP